MRSTRAGADIDVVVKRARAEHCCIAAASGPQQSDLRGMTGQRSYFQNSARADQVAKRRIHAVEQLCEMRAYQNHATEQRCEKLNASCNMLKSYVAVVVAQDSIVSAEA